jgi:hypothetical protein
MKPSFTVDGEAWVAWESGGGAYGTGNRGLGNVRAVHFARADAPDVPLFEALLGAGRFDDLFEEELLTLFRGARKVVDPGDVPIRPMGRRTLSG